MNNSNTLRTQYVEELNDYKTQLKDILLKFGEDVTDKTGLTDMVEKVNTTKGSEVLPFYKFTNCESVETQKFINKINLSFQKDLSNCFAYWYDVDLSNINTISGENFDKFLYFPALKPEANGASYLDTVTLGPGFRLDNATSLNYFLSGEYVYWSDINDRGLRIIDKGVKEQINYNEVSINYFMSYLGFGNYAYSNPGPGKNAKEAAKVFKKIRFENVKTLDGFWQYGGSLLSGSVDKYGGEISAIEISEFINTIFDYTFNLENVESMNNLLYSCEGYSTSGTGGGAIHFKLFPKRKQVFNKLKTISGWFRSTSVDCVNLANWTFPVLEEIKDTFYNGSSGTESSKYIHLGNVPNPTLKKITNLYSNHNSEVLDLSGWNLGGVNYISTFGYNSYSGGFKILIFGYDLGKGYTSSTANYSYYTLNFSTASNLEHDSVLDIFNKLYDLNITYDVANGGTLATQKIDLHADVIAQLTPEEIAIATNKGWTVI